MRGLFFQSPKPSPPANQTGVFGPLEDHGATMNSGKPVAIGSKSKATWCNICSPARNGAWIFRGFWSGESTNWTPAPGPSRDKQQVNRCFVVARMSKWTCEITRVANEMDRFRLILAQFPKVCSMFSCQKVWHWAGCAGHHPSLCHPKP